VQTAVDVLGMRVDQHDVVATRSQFHHQPEVVADHVTWLRAVDDDDVARGPVAVLRDELCDRPAWTAVVDVETVRKLDRHEVGHFQCIVVSFQILLVRAYKIQTILLLL